jgi:hypothetical protein
LVRAALGQQQVLLELAVKVFSSMLLPLPVTVVAVAPVLVTPWALVGLLSEMVAETVEQEATEIVVLLEPAAVAEQAVTPEREVEGVTLVPLQPLRMV